MEGINQTKNGTARTLKILAALLPLFTFFDILPAFSDTQTTETEPQIKWDFGNLIAQCQYGPVFLSSRITGRFEIDVDLSNDTTARKYVQQGIDTAINSCRNIFKAQGWFTITLYSLKKEELVEAKFSLTSKDYELRNYAAEAIELSKAQKNADEEVERLIKAIGIPLDWEIIQQPYNLGAKIKIKFKAPIDLSDDRTVKRCLAIARDIAQKKFSYLPFWKNPSRWSSEVRPMPVEIYLYSLTGPENEYYISAYYDNNGSLRYNNYAAEYTKKIKQAQAIKDWLGLFFRKYKVEVWLASNEMKSQLAANPVQWKGKIVGLQTEFGGMLSKDAGVFSLTPDLNFIVVKKLPSARFTRSGEQFFLAGQVQGLTKAQLPLLGSASVPELRFIGAEPILLPPR